MPHYPALLDGKAGAYGVTFPDLPGIAAMGETVEGALMNAEEALRDYVAEAKRDGVQVPDPSSIETVPLRDGSVLAAFQCLPHRRHAHQKTYGVLALLLARNRSG